MGIGGFIRKFNDTACSCDEIEQLGVDVPYFTGGRPTYEVYISNHFITEMRQALRYDTDLYGARRFKMSQIEYDFWLKFQPFNAQVDPIQYTGELQMASEELDNWLHREVQNLPHDGPVRLNPEKCEGTLYESLAIPEDTSPSLPIWDPTEPPMYTGDVYLLNGANAITYAFQAGGHVLANVADGLKVTDGATVGQVADNVSDSLERGTYD